MCHTVALILGVNRLPHFVKATVAGVSTNKHSETFLKFEVTKTERHRTNGIADLTEQNIVVAVFTEDEFLMFADYFTRETGEIAR